MTLNIRPGTICVFDGRVIQIDGQNNLTEMLARDIATGNILEVPISKIKALPKSTSQGKKDLSEIGETEWNRCCELAKDLETLESDSRVSKDQLTKIAKKNGMSARQLQRYRAKYRTDPRASTLARSKGGRPLGLSRLNENQEAIIRHAIQKHYLRAERPSKEYLVLRVQSMARRVGASPPSRNAILLRLQREEGWHADRIRHGSEAAKQKWQARPGALNAGKPLDLIQIDHTMADVILLDDDHSKPIGRPWITVAIDVASRCVLGMYISMDAPSAIAVSLCIEHAVLPKAENDKDIGIWPMYGMPKKILVDNGKDFRSMALMRGCSEHGINLSWRPLKTPHYGAHIERLIGSLMKIAHLLPGTTFSNIRERGNYDSEKKATLNLDEFRRWMTQKVCRQYHVVKHRSLKTTPSIAWEQGLISEDGERTTPALVNAPHEFRMDFLPFVMRKVRRTGVEFSASRYWHDDLAPMLNSREEAIVKYDPRTPGHIWIRRKDGILVKARAIAGRAAGESTIAPAISAATKAEQDAEFDRGLDVTDQIEAEAKRQRRMKKRKESKGGKEPPVNQTIEYSPVKRKALPPDQTIEEWD